MRIEKSKTITFVMSLSDRFMKPFLSICVILILFQTLLFGSLVKLEFPENIHDQWGETLLHRQIVIDPFLLPGKDGIEQCLQKNNWIPYHFNTTVIIRDNRAFHDFCLQHYNPFVRNDHKTIPVFILNGILRI